MIVDLWAPWCGPCKTLGPMLEKAVADTGGAVELAKVNVDENPRIAQTFGVQSIPAVFAISDGQVVDQFIGALPEAQVTAFVQRLAPAAERGRHAGRRGRRGLAAPGGPRARAGPRRRHRGAGPHPDRPGRRPPRRWPCCSASPRPRPAGRWPPRPACSRPGSTCSGTGREEIEAKLDELLDRVRDDDAARQEFVDLLETMGADDPRTNEYRRALAARLF